MSQNNEYIENIPKNPDKAKEYFKELEKHGKAFVYEHPEFKNYYVYLVSNFSMYKVIKKSSNSGKYFYTSLTKIKSRVNPRSVFRYEINGNEYPYYIYNIFSPKDGSRFTGVYFSKETNLPLHSPKKAIKDLISHQDRKVMAISRKEKDG